MKEPSRRTSRQFLALGLVAVLTIGGGGFMLGRATSPRVTVPAPVRPLPAPTPMRVAEPEAPPRVLGRADLIALAATAADGLAAGKAIPTSDVDGRAFELLLPFGCNGPAAEGRDGGTWWRYDEEAEALRLHAAPSAFAAAEWFPSASAGVDAIEGFWLSRPWTSSEACPAIAPQAPATSDPVTLPGQTLAVAQVFAKDAPRQARRAGKPFETVNKVEPGEIDTSQGFLLRLRGRLSQAPGGNTVQCRQPAGAEQRPICMIAVSLDEVAFVSADRETTFATWPVQEARAR